MEGLVGVRVGRPIGKGIRIAIQASSSLLLPDPRMSAAKAALVKRGVELGLECGIGLGLGLGFRLRLWLG